MLLEQEHDNTRSSTSRVTGHMKVCSTYVPSSALVYFLDGPRIAGRQYIISFFGTKSDAQRKWTHSNMSS